MTNTGSSKSVMKSILEKLQSRLSPPLKGQKVGHFVVVATGGGRPMRFTVGLESLNDPEFIKLLKQAEEEFGFSQTGALSIPCKPNEIRRIIGQRGGISV